MSIALEPWKYENHPMVKVESEDCPENCTMKRGSLALEMESVRNSFQAMSLLFQTRDAEVKNQRCIGKITSDMQMIDRLTRFHTITNCGFILRNPFYDECGH